MAAGQTICEAKIIGYSFSQLMESHIGLTEYLDSKDLYDTHRICYAAPDKSIIGDETAIRYDYETQKN